MLINTNDMFSVSAANQNFSVITRKVDKDGKAILLKNNKPKYVVLDINSAEVLFDLTEDEWFEIITKRILEKYLPAFKELAK